MEESSIEIEKQPSFIIANGKGGHTERRPLQNICFILLHSTVQQSESSSCMSSISDDFLINLFLFAERRTCNITTLVQKVIIILRNLSCGLPEN